MTSTDSGDSPDRARIEGKVAQILNARELVINRGANQGVEVGMRFAVLNSNGGDVVDPDTGEVLGSVTVPKVLMKVVRVDEKFAVASTFREKRTAAGPLYTTILSPNLFAPPQTVVETLRTDDRTYKEELSDEDSYVHVGDPVQEYHEGDFSGW